VVRLADLVAVFHDACGFTVQHDAVLANSNLIDSGGFGE